MTSLRMNQFYKTKTCPWYFKGRCERGDACRFAHNEQEKRDLPDLSRTSFCPMLLKHSMCHDQHCRFAHNVDQLRATDDMYKTSLCFMFMKSRCEAGSACRHAHGTHELRAAPASQQERPGITPANTAGVLTPSVSMGAVQAHGGGTSLGSNLPMTPLHQNQLSGLRQQQQQQQHQYPQQPSSSSAANHSGHRSQPQERMKQHASSKDRKLHRAHTLGDSVVKQHPSSLSGNQSASLHHHQQHHHGLGSKAASLKDLILPKQMSSNSLSMQMTTQTSSSLLRARDGNTHSIPSASGTLSNQIRARRNPQGNANSNHPRQQRPPTQMHQPNPSMVMSGAESCSSSASSPQYSGKTSPSTRNSGDLNIAPPTSQPVDELQIDWRNQTVNNNRTAMLAGATKEQQPLLAQQASSTATHLNMSPQTTNNYYPKLPMVMHSPSLARMFTPEIEALMNGMSSMSISQSQSHNRQQQAPTTTSINNSNIMNQMNIQQQHSNIIPNYDFGMGSHHPHHHHPQYLRQQQQQMQEHQAATSLASHPFRPSTIPQGPFSSVNFAAVAHPTNASTHHHAQSWNNGSYIQQVTKSPSVGSPSENPQTIHNQTVNSSPSLMRVTSHPNLQSPTNGSNNAPGLRYGPERQHFNTPQQYNNGCNLSNDQVASALSILNAFSSNMPQTFLPSFQQHQQLPSVSGGAQPHNLWSQAQQVPYETQAVVATGMQSPSSQNAVAKSRPADTETDEHQQHAESSNVVGNTLMESAHANPQLPTNVEAYRLAFPPPPVIIDSDSSSPNNRSVLMPHQFHLNGANAVQSLQPSSVAAASTPMAMMTAEMAAAISQANGQLGAFMSSLPPDAYSDQHYQRMMQYAYEVYLSQIQAVSLIAYQQQQQRVAAAAATAGAVVQQSGGGEPQPTTPTSLPQVVPLSQQLPASATSQLSPSVQQPTSPTSTSSPSRLIDHKVPSDRDPLDTSSTEVDEGEAPHHEICDGLIITEPSGGKTVVGATMPSVVTAADGQASEPPLMHQRPASSRRSSSVIYPNMPSIVFDSLSSSQCFPSPKSFSDLRLSIGAKFGSSSLPLLPLQAVDLASSRLRRPSGVVVDNSRAQSIESEIDDDGKYHARTRSMEVYPSDNFEMNVSSRQSSQRSQRQRVGSQHSNGKVGMREIPEELGGVIISTNEEEEAFQEGCDDGVDNDVGERSPIFQSSNNPKTVGTDEDDQRQFEDSCLSLLERHHHQRRDLSRSLDLQLNNSVASSVEENEEEIMLRRNMVTPDPSNTNDDVQQIVPSSLSAALSAAVTNMNDHQRRASIQRLLSGEIDLSPNDSQSIASLVDYLGLARTSAERQLLDDLSSSPVQSSGPLKSSFDDLQPDGLSTESFTLSPSQPSSSRVSKSREEEEVHPSEPAMNDPRESHSCPTTAATTATTTPTAGMTKRRRRISRSQEDKHNGATQSTLAESSRPFAAHDEEDDTLHSQTTVTIDNSNSDQHGELVKLAATLLTHHSSNTERQQQQQPLSDDYGTNNMSRNNSNTLHSSSTSKTRTSYSVTPTHQLLSPSSPPSQNVSRRHSTSNIYTHHPEPLCTSDDFGELSRTQPPQSKRMKTTDFSSSSTPDDKFSDFFDKQAQQQQRRPTEINREDSIGPTHQQVAASSSATESPSHLLMEFWDSPLLTSPPRRQREVSGTNGSSSSTSAAFASPPQSQSLWLRGDAAAFATASPYFDLTTVGLDGSSSTIDNDQSSTFNHRDAPSNVEVIESLFLEWPKGGAVPQKH